MGEEDFGSRLKAFRQNRKLTQAQLAEQSGVTTRALAYWEAGQHAPGNTELNSVAEALQLTLEERQALMALLPTGKAGKLARVTSVWSEIAPPPGIGDLIRALRWRKRWSREQLAHTMGVHRTTAIRWEEFHVTPSPETLTRLCDVLGALPEERAVLLTAQATPLKEGPPLLENCRNEAAQLEQECYTAVDPLFDLRGYLLAGNLWHLAARQPTALPVLAQTYAAHACYSCLRGNYAAALDFSGRTFRLVLQENTLLEATTMQALWASANALTYRSKTPHPKQSLQQIQQWLPRLQRPQARATALLYIAWWATEDMNLALAREHWHLANAALAQIPDPSPRLLMSIRSTHADLLAREGHTEEAVEATARIGGHEYPRQISTLLFQAALFMGVHELSQADTLVRRAYALIETHDAELQRVSADAVAARLERMS